jgi:gamma-glutamyltranspeptidase/glutathione hydrolase
LRIHRDFCRRRAPLGFFVAACAVFAASAAPGSGPAAASASAAFHAQPLHPPGYAVASAHPLATEAGIEVLRAGGNAFDAAVAVSAALAVVEPYSSGLGGGGFWLLHSGADGREAMLDGRETAPAAASRQMYLDRSGHALATLSRDGALAGAIPGEPAALDYLAAHYGRLGLARDLAPAIRLAREGFALDAHFAAFIASQAERLSPAARAVFMPDGKPLAANAPLVQPDLAATLEALAREGHDGFYRGAVARKLVEGVRAAGGLWTEQDLADYRVVLRKPIVTRFRGYRIVSAPPPSAGGVALVEIFHQLAALHWDGGRRPRADAELIEAMRRAYRDRLLLGDPDFVAMPLARLLSPSYGAQLARSIDPARATPSADLPPPGEWPDRAAQEGADTSHLSIVDAQGNYVAATVTVNLRFGSGYMAPGTGVIVNDEMDDFAASVHASNAYGLVGSQANEIAPGKRPLSSMSPSFASGPNGVLVIGTPGGSRIVTMVALGILEFIGGADARQIVNTPRFHMQYQPDRVEFEPDAFDERMQEALRARGYVLQALDHGYGNMQVVVWRQADNFLDAASDPRGVGSARVVQPVRALPKKPLKPRAPSPTAVGG